MPRKAKNHDPVLRVHKVGWYSTNSGRRNRGMPPLSFEEYMAAKNAGNVMQGQPRKRKVRVVVPRQERSYVQEWKAENEKRRKAGLLPLKYDDYVKHWKDWI